MLPPEGCFYLKDAVCSFSRSPVGSARGYEVGLPGISLKNVLGSDSSDSSVPPGEQGDYAKPVPTVWKGYEGLSGIAGTPGL